MRSFLTSEEAKTDDILPNIEAFSNEKSILQNTTDDDFTLKEGTK